MPLPSSQLRIFLVDSIGAYRGMHYYSFALGAALAQEDVNVTLLSTPETAVHAWKPDNLSVKGVFRHIYGKQPKWLRGLWYGWALLQIAWLAWRQKPEIIHWHFYQIPFLDRFLLWWLKRLHIVLVATVHDVVPLTFGPLARVKNTRRYKALYALSDGLIAHSHQALVSLGGLDASLPAKTVLTPLGHYLHVARRAGDKVEARQRLGFAANEPLILVFGSIKPNKRLDWAIETLSDVVKIFPSARLVVVGQPQDQAVTPFVALAEESGVADHVYWHLDVVEDALLLLYFAAADVIFFPYEWIYQSAALVMAMSFGQPVVATAVGGNKELVLPGKTGVLVTPGNIGEMGQALIDLLGDREKARQMGQAAREYVSTALSWEQIALETRQYYLQLFAEKVNASPLTPPTRRTSLSSSKINN